MLDRIFHVLFLEDLTRAVSEVGLFTTNKISEAPSGGRSLGPVSHVESRALQIYLLCLLCELRFLYGKYHGFL